MKHIIITTLLSATFLFFPFIQFAQVISLGTTADFVLFTTNGALTNTGNSFLTGHVGSNVGSSTDFGNVDGGMHDQDGVSAQAMADLAVLYGQLDDAIPTLFPATLLGNGDTLTTGVHYIGQAASLELELILDAENNPDAIFIIQINGAFSCGANSSVTLVNGAQACKVFWKTEGEVNIAAGSTMRGTIVANQSAITLNTGDVLEGRALAINGAISIDGITAYKPIGCGSPILTGPAAPDLGSTSCFALYTSTGEMMNTGITTVHGAIGTNTGLTTGFDSLTVTGTIHPIPDYVTHACASDLLVTYSYLNTLTADIELLYPAQFGNNLVLTPHTYAIHGAVSFTDTLYLNAQNNPDAVFVISTFGAFSTGTYSKVVLINGAQAKNVYWKVEGALEINDYSEFKGTMVVNDGAVDLNTGVNLDGRILATVGEFHTASMTAISDSDCGITDITGMSTPENNGISLSFAPNPFVNVITITTNEVTIPQNLTLTLYNALGIEVMNSKILHSTATIDASSVLSGVHFYRVSVNGLVIQSGSLLAL